VLAGGLGTRLKPRFGDLPKGLAPLGGRPFLAHQIEWLRGHGVREVVLCAGYGAERLEASLGDGASLGVTIHWSREPEPLGTGGALRHAARWVDGPALVANGDTLLACDPWELERARWERGAIGALALYQVPDAAARGRVITDATGRILEFAEKDPTATCAWVSGGLYAFSPRLWDLLPAGASSLERDVLPALAARGALAGLEREDAFFDIGTPEEWERLERRFAS